MDRREFLKTTLAATALGHMPVDAKKPYLPVMVNPFPLNVQNFDAQSLIRQMAMDIDDKILGEIRHES